MAIQAIIMAGGAGTRLRPLTCDLPKPLAPLCGAPIMDYTLQLLRKHGYNHADVTLWYRPKDVQSCFGAGRHGVSLTYIIEDKPVGTAGSVLMAAGKARDTVLVMSGDGLTSVDLTAALAYHKQRKAAATLVLQRTDIPLAYGVVMTDSQGRITRFIEKPDWSRVFSSLVNTGVYLLEPQALALIPEDKPFDFGRDLFPLMLEKGMALYGWESGAYWCDVGDAQAFLKAQSDLLAGRAGFIPADPGIRAAEGAMISPDSYVASGARIGRGAAISRSCVLEGAVIGDGAQLDGAIVCAGARVEQGAVLQSGCVLGAGAVAGAFSTLQGQARVWPGIRLVDDAVISDAVQLPSMISVIAGKVHYDTPAQLSTAAAAFMKTGSRKRVAVMYAGKGIAAYHTVLGALSAYGADAVQALGQGTQGMLAFAIPFVSADGGLLCGENTLWTLDKHGLPLSSAASAGLEAAARRQELPALYSRPEAIQSRASLGSHYVQALAKRFYCKTGTTAALQCDSRFLFNLSRDALSLSGHTVDNQSPIAIYLKEDGLQMRWKGEPLSSTRQKLLCLRALQKSQEIIYDTFDLAPEGFDIRPCDWSKECLAQMLLTQDGLSQALLLLRLFSREAPQQALDALPQIAEKQISIPCETADKGYVLEALLKSAVPRPQGGLSARHGDAHALIRPDPALPLMHVAVSAHSAETADELCDFYTGKVLGALRSRI
ncbi:MAG: NTP transferase domain-containing protein [Clostridia bacterium]|nr:NTP transferase domain-containing protein [Clostridia bacterium]